MKGIRAGKEAASGEAAGSRSIDGASLFHLWASGATDDAALADREGVGRSQVGSRDLGFATARASAASEIEGRRASSWALGRGSLCEPWKLAAAPHVSPGPPLRADAASASEGPDLMPAVRPDIFDLSSAPASKPRLSVTSGGGGTASGPSAKCEKPIIGELQLSVTSRPRVCSCSSSWASRDTDSRSSARSVACCFASASLTSASWRSWSRLWTSSRSLASEPSICWITCRRLALSSSRSAMRSSAPRFASSASLASLTLSRVTSTRWASAAEVAERADSKSAARSLHSVVVSLAKSWRTSRQSSTFLRAVSAPSRLLARALSRARASGFGSATSSPSPS
mmetsp:Transcript_44970/g.133100  ORF Transcript_44970/g.133100 Transcript_44970/m.133100 type:complete len:341 (-) Transcript_44970:281-1303(-)